MSERDGAVDEPTTDEAPVDDAPDAPEAPAGESVPEEPEETEAPQRNLFDRAGDRIDAFHRKIPPLAVAHAVLKKHSEDRCDQLSMLLAYKGFFCLFPLMLAFVNVLGLILQDNDELREDLIDSTLSSVPIIGTEIANNAEALGGSVWVLIGSILVSLWAGFGLLDMIQEALNTAWQVPMYDRPPYLLRRLKDLPGALIVGFGAMLTGASQWILADGTDAWVRNLLGALLPILAGAISYLGLHWLLCARKVPFTAHLPAMATVGLGWWGLQTLGLVYVRRILEQSSDTYGVFVIVFGLLTWVYLTGALYLYSIELAAVLYERLWPRSFSGRDLTEVDQRAITAVVERESRVRGTEITVDVPRDPA